MRKFTLNSNLAKECTTGLSLFNVMFSCPAGHFNNDERTVHTGVFFTAQRQPPHGTAINNQPDQHKHIQSSFIPPFSTNTTLYLHWYSPIGIPPLSFLPTQTCTPVLHVQLSEGTIISLPVGPHLLVLLIVEGCHALPCPFSMPACEVACPFCVFILRTVFMVPSLFFGSDIIPIVNSWRLLVRLGLSKELAVDLIFWRKSW